MPVTKQKRSLRKQSSPKPAKKRTRTPDFVEYPAWSTAKFWSFVRSGLRAKWSRWPPKFEVLKNAQRPYKGPNTRQKYEYQCSECKQWHIQKDVEVDHITPAGSLNDWSQLAGFCERLFVGVGKLRVLCKVCHKAITQKEKARE